MCGDYRLTATPHLLGFYVGIWTPVFLLVQHTLYLLISLPSPAIQTLLYRESLSHRQPFSGVKSVLLWGLHPEPSGWLFEETDEEITSQQFLPPPSMLTELIFLLNLNGRQFDRIRTSSSARLALPINCFKKRYLAVCDSLGYHFLLGEFVFIFGCFRGHSTPMYSPLFPRVLR